MTDYSEDPERFHVEGDHRSGESGSLFGGASGASIGRSAGTDAGLIAGARDDPVLVCGVGYPLLGDMSLGTVVAYRVAAWELPGVAVADCSHTPVAAYQTITATDYEAVLVVGGEKRDGEINDGSPSADPGAIHEYGPESVEVPEDRDQITRVIGQTAMGLNTLENVLVVTRALGEFPDRTTVIGVEPAYDSWGMNVREFTDPVDEALEDVTDRVLEHLEETLDELGVDRNPNDGADASGDGGTSRGADASGDGEASRDGASGDGGTSRDADASSDADGSGDGDVGSDDGGDPADP